MYVHTWRIRLKDTRAIKQLLNKYGIFRSYHGTCDVCNYTSASILLRETKKDDICICLLKETNISPSTLAGKHVVKLSCLSDLYAVCVCHYPTRSPGYVCNKRTSKLGTTED